MKKLAFVLSLALIFGVYSVNAQVAKKEVKKSAATTQSVSQPAASTTSSAAPATATKPATIATTAKPMDHSHSTAMHATAAKKAPAKKATPTAKKEATPVK